MTLGNNVTKMPLSSELRQFGSAQESLTTVDVPHRDPGNGEILIEMVAAPINPADINVIEGKYGELPSLPSPIGNEGVGRVAKLGAGVTGLEVGQMVLPLTFGTWTSEMVVPAARVVPLPTDVDAHQAAMLTVNPATAWRILHDFVKLVPGDWVVQNAANSGVGRSTIQLARALGLHTLNVVRRPELVDELREAGGDVVVTEGCDLRKEVKSLCAGARPRLGLNAVGGSSALNVANALDRGGTLVTFGAMSKQALKIPNGLLIFSDISFRGFWLKRWRDAASPEEIRATYTELARHLANGTLLTPVAETFPLRDLVSAVDAAGREQRRGKVLVTMGT